MITYDVKDIRELTRLTHKQLFELKEGIPGIGPKNDAGYKQYSENDLIKLRQAALLLQLEVKPKVINSIFSDENYSKKETDRIISEIANNKIKIAQEVLRKIEP